ncbi:SDR family oxidoreductase [Reinekea sp.]|jgi:UDP-glucose 4-epimerase|uniref:SDR family oxidoreductase n=2 Tax=Reinekea sp. TaxID=1970455 RepID=UPI00398A35AE
MKVLITGASGYIGQLAGAQLTKQNIKTIGLDIHVREDSPFPIFKMDILNPELSTWLKENQISHVVHLASLLQTTGDRQRDFEIDVGGTQNVLDACIAANVKHITVTSSGAAYGYYKDNPEWLTESDTIRGNYEFPYSWNKRKVEEMLAEYGNKHPELKQLILRPGTVLGAKTRNLITNLFMKKRIMAIQGSDSPFVFIWDQDVAAIVTKGVMETKVGKFNLAGTGALTIGAIAKKLNKPLLMLPAWLIKTALFFGHKVGATQYGPEQIDFLRYRPVLDNSALINEFGYLPEKTSEEVFDLFVDNLK